MINSKVEQFQEYIFPKSIQANFYELNYLSDKYQPRNSQEENQIKSAMRSFLHLNVVATIFSMGFLISFRRFFTNKNEFFSAKKFPMYGLFMLFGQTIGLIFGTDQTLEKLKPLRKQLANECNSVYMKHLVDKYLKFNQIYKPQNKLFSDFMTFQEYNAWFEKNQLDFTVFDVQK